MLIDMICFSFLRTKEFAQYNDRCMDNNDGIKLHITATADTSTTLEKWATWPNDPPYIIFAGHLVLRHLDQVPFEMQLANFNEFLLDAVRTSTANGFGDTDVQIVNQPIKLDIYVGVSSTVHNQSALGYSLDRGIASF